MVNESKKKKNGENIWKSDRGVRELCKVLEWN